MSTDLLFNQYRDRFEKILEKTFSSEKNNLAEAIRYSLLQKGKRLRPLLVYITGIVLNADITSLDMPACAIEYIHTYSLIHDDLPAMDNDDMRRGKPSCHKMFGESTAILAGDTLLALAFETLSQHSETLAPLQQNKMIHTLAEACGLNGITLGQYFDLNPQNDCTLEQLNFIHTKKTGALFVAAVRLGIIAANNSDLKINHALTQFANSVGVAFQIKDDIDDWENEQQNIASYPNLIGIEATIKKYNEEKNKALVSLASVQLDQSLLKSFLEQILPK